MHKRPFGPDKKMVSEVGLGTWQIGGSWGTVDGKTAMEILQTATQAGITFFDTADVYGDGRSERFIGKFLKDHGSITFFVGLEEKSLMDKSLGAQLELKAVA